MSEVIQVECPECAHPARVNAALQGRYWQCQHCGTKFEITAPVVRAESEQIVAACQCGRRFRIHRKHVGKTGKCPACGQKVAIQPVVAAATGHPSRAAESAPADPSPGHAGPQVESSLEDASESQGESADGTRSRLLLVVGAIAVLLIGIGVTAFMLGQEGPGKGPRMAQKPAVSDGERTGATPAAGAADRTAGARHGPVPDGVAARAPQPSIALPGAGRPPASAPAASHGLVVTASRPAMPVQAGPSPAPGSPPSAAPQVRTIDAEERVLEGHKAPITDLAFSPDGKYLATSASRPDACVILWDAGAGREIRRFADPETRVVNAVAISADSRLLLSSDGPRCRVWDIETGRQLHLLTAHTSDVLTVAFSHHGPAATTGRPTSRGPRLALTGSWDKTIRLWDAAQGKELRKFEGHTSIVTAVAFAAADLTFTSAAQDGTIRQWDVAGGRQLRQWSTGARAISSIALSPDGLSVAVGARPYVSSKETVPAENPLCIWSNDGQELRRFPVSADGVSAVAFSGDGRYLLSSDSNRVRAGRRSSDELHVRLWNVDDGTEVLRLRGSGFALAQACFAPDGRHIVTAAADRAIRFWKLPDDITVGDAPAVATAELKSLPVIAKSLSTQVTDAIEAGRFEEADRLIHEAQSDLRLFAATTQIPLWDNSIAPLLRMADSKRLLLAQKAGGTPAPQGPLKLTPDQNRELLAIRQMLTQASTLVRQNKLSGAQASVFEAQEKLKAFVAASDVPEWSLPVASVYQLAAARQTELDARRGVEASRAAALAEQAKKATAPQGPPARADGLAVGQMAPPFTAATLDGKQVSLQQFRGKWVLIDFWATWCGPCLAEMPNLKELYAATAKDKRFAMISLSIDNQMDDPLKYATENQLGWIQGFLGQGWNAPVLKAYGVHGIPALFLIAPDGRISAKGLRGERIKAAVSEALGSAPAAAARR